MSTATQSLADRRAELQARDAKIADEIQSFVDRMDAGETLTPEQSERFERQVASVTALRTRSRRSTGAKAVRLSHRVFAGTSARRSARRGRYELKAAYRVERSALVHRQQVSREIALVCVGLKNRAVVPTDEEPPARR
jgi:hypothetical protein